MSLGSEELKDQWLACSETVTWQLEVVIYNPSSPAPPNFFTMIQSEKHVLHFDPVCVIHVCVMCLYMDSTHWVDKKQFLSPIVHSPCTNVPLNRTGSEAEAAMKVLCQGSAHLSTAPLHGCPLSKGTEKGNTGREKFLLM